MIDISEVRMLQKKGKPRPEFTWSDKFWMKYMMDIKISSKIKSAARHAQNSCYVSMASVKDKCREKIISELKEKGYETVYLCIYDNLKIMW